MTGVILTEELSRSNGNLKAVDSIHLNVQKGEIYGFLGLKRAGKTTTIRMLPGMIRPSEGRVFLFGIQMMHAWCSIVLLLLALPFQTNEAQVKVYEGAEVIPTYQLGPDETSPIFYTGRGVQGAAGRYYPYPAQISLGEEKKDVAYHMVYLENEYLKVTLIPSLGGKLFSAIDKTNGHELFHRNSTIKPDLIGTLGAWISGGIEWCFPNHHRATTLMPADYRIVENGDGSVTVWVGETEKSMRLRGIIGITLRPGRSFIEADYRLTNPGPVTRNFKFWANVAISADEYFRTFWPPSQEIAVFHNNSSFTHWPISHDVYRGIDYTDGVDLTWWKNHPSPVSFFFWQGEEGFIGGYNYAVNAGTIHVGDTYKSRISKLWQFGPGLQGQNARRKLTDDGAAYVELMIGTFSNNQPDYSWFAPHMTKYDKHYWYPLRDIEIAKNATRDAAITLQVKEEKSVFFGVNTTKKMEGARLVLSYEGKVVSSESMNVGPTHPYTSTWEGPEELDESKLYLVFRDRDGNEVVSYSPYQKVLPELPDPFDRFKPASEYESVEDLYLAGRAVEQFSRAFINPEDYYLRALEISPDDYRVNMALGIRRVRQWKFVEAEEFFETAARKLQFEYLQIKEGELYYYWALAQRAQGNIQAARRNFSYAAFHYEWYSAAHYQLALIESQQGNSGKALAHISDAYSTNNRDAGIVLLYSALLRKVGKEEEALAMLDKALGFDPLNYALMFERELVTGESLLDDMQGYMQDVENNYLEIATHYLNAGLYEDAIHLLTGTRDPQNPLLLYYLGYCLARNGQPDKAENIIASARNKNYDYIFPYRFESERVLRYAITADPSSPYGFYLLGNLLYEKRPEEAISAWEAAAEIDPDQPMVQRNLAFGAYHHQREVDRAIDLMTAAIRDSPENPLWYDELYSYYEASRRDPKECLAILEAHEEVVRKNVSAPKGLVKLFNLNGEYDQAIRLLDSHHFRTWEGGRSIYWHHVDAHVLKSIELMDEGNYREAISHLERAMEYPENLEVGKPLNDERNALIYYLTGIAHEEMDNEETAREAFQKSAACENSRAWPDLDYYQGLALKKLGNPERAADKFKQLEQRGKKLLGENISGSGIGISEGGSAGTMKSVSEGYYLQGLAYMGKEEQTKAKEMFAEAVKAYKYSLWAQYYLHNWNIHLSD